MRYILRACILRKDTERYVDELIRFCKDADIDEIMMCEDNVFISAIAQPTTAHRESAAILKRAVKRCKSSGIRCEFYLKSLVGHFTSSTFSLPYTKFVGANGEESVNEPCLLDEKFADYAAEILSYYAECGFDGIMIDDDFRSVNHCNGQIGCFCDIHLQKTSERYGKSLTREALIAAFCRGGGDQESAKIRKCFREINFEGQLAFARKIEKAVHNVDAEVQIGLMVSGLKADLYQGRDIEKLLKAFAGEGKPAFVRPPGGYYSDMLGADVFYGFDNGLEYRKKLGEKVRYVSEVDVFSPRNIFTKSARILDLQCQLHALAGFDELTLNIIDHYGTPPSESVEYSRVLKENKNEYARLYELVKGKKPRGIGVPLPDNYAEKLTGNRYGAMGAHNVAQILHRLGLPVCYELCDVNFLTGETLNCYNDEEFTELLKKGLLLDEEATRIAIDRGFSEYIGVTYENKIDSVCFEMLTDAEENGGYSGLRFPAFTNNVHNAERAYRLKAIKGATVLTEFVDAELQKTGDCAVYFENKLGGRIFVTGSAFNGNNLFYKGRRAQLHAVAEKMFGKKLPFDVKNAVSVAPLWYKGESGENVVLYNFGLDEQIFDFVKNGAKEKIVMPPLSFKNINLGD